MHRPNSSVKYKKLYRVLKVVHCSGEKRVWLAGQVIKNRSRSTTEPKTVEASRCRRLQVSTNPERLSFRNILKLRSRPDSREKEKQGARK